MNSDLFYTQAAIQLHASAILSEFGPNHTMLAGAFDADGSYVAFTAAAGNTCAVRKTWQDPCSWGLQTDRAPPGWAVGDAPYGFVERSVDCALVARAGLVAGEGKLGTAMRVFGETVEAEATDGAEEHEEYEEHGAENEEYEEAEEEAAGGPPKRHEEAEEESGPPKRTLNDGWQFHAVVRSGPTRPTDQNFTAVVLHITRFIFPTSLTLAGVTDRLSEINTAPITRPRGLSFLAPSNPWRTQAMFTAFAPLSKAADDLGWANNPFTTPIRTIVASYGPGSEQWAVAAVKAAKPIAIVLVGPRTSPRDPAAANFTVY